MNPDEITLWMRRIRDKGFLTDLTINGLMPEAFKSIDLESVIKLDDDSYWAQLKTRSGSVEGRLYTQTHPKKPSNKIILFEPGFPGDGSTRLDKLWAKKLVENGWTVFAALHNGTIINGEHSDTYINCPERQGQARLRGQEVLGVNQNPTIEDWLKEPRVMMEAFAPHFDEVVLVGHSFGSLATLSSLIDFARDYPVIARHIKRFVSLSGTVGRLDENRKYYSIDWRKYMSMDAMRKKVRIGEVDENMRSLIATSDKIHSQTSAIPDIDFLFVVPRGGGPGSGDKLVNPLESINMIRSLRKGGRNGKLIIDQTETTDESRGIDPHDMNNLSAETFLELVNVKQQASGQVSRITKV